MEPLGVWEEKEIYLLREEHKACFEIAGYNEEKRGERCDGQERFFCI